KDCQLHPRPTTWPSNQAMLLADGHQLVFEEIQDWNMVELIVNGENIFHCNITDLDF
ncbi:hypothetical protein NDU88_010266, partial [Pleurodeles waltl]